MQNTRSIGKLLASTGGREIHKTEKKPSAWSTRYRRCRPATCKSGVRSVRGRLIRAPTGPMLHRLPQGRTKTLALEYPEPISFDRKTLTRFEESSRLEWIETNGLGGYASSTVVGASTRQYHGLLVVPCGEGGCRYVMLAKLDERLRIGDQAYDISCNKYPEVVHPEGHLLLREFRLDPIPTYVYQLGGGVRLEKKVFMLHGVNTVVVSYRLTGAPDGAELQVRPMIAAREFHGLGLENSGVEVDWEEERAGLIAYRAYPGTPTLRFSHDASEVLTSPFWYRQLEYEMEAARGLPFREDLFVPFSFSYKLGAGPARGLIVSTEMSLPWAGEAAALETQERARRAMLVLKAAPSDRLEAALVVASSTFIAPVTHSRTGVISGYHWFGEYCRDTLISLPGLTLAVGNFSAAREILSAVGGHFSRGMLPNTFDERTGEPVYTSVDASLWFIYAVQKFLAYTSDYEFVQTALYDKMTDVIEHYKKGAGRAIAMDRNGLLDAGSPTNQMSWMNVTVAGKPVTPRHGKAVEVNALWYNALKVVAELAREFGDERANTFAALATVVKRSFQTTFWNEDGGYLFDCVRKGESDASIRPNQVLAVSLPHPVIEGEQAAGIVDCVEKELLTPFGLRTLSPRDPSYRGRHEGNPASRDKTYHQGTVWTWLLGPFITAYLRVRGRSQAAIDEAYGFIEPFRDHLRQAGLGTVSEIFDGDPPYTPRGCISKAMSVAELLRAYREDILGRKPVS